MTLAERIGTWIASLPSDSSSVTLTRADLRALLSETDVQSVSVAARDLTVEEVGERTGRSPSTVRGWLIAGQLQGYKLNRRDWRVTETALRTFLEAQRSPAPSRVDDSEPVDIGAWRRIVQ